jgi:cobalt-zinc-cadmium efflux system membrane fusion protein
MEQMTELEGVSGQGASATTTLARARRALLFAGGGLVVLVGAIWILVSREPPAAAALQGSPGRDVPTQDGSIIRFSDNFAKRSGLTTEAARFETMAPVVNVTGTLTYDARKFAAVGARIAGRVRRVHKIEGDRVREGEVLAELESAELGKATADALAARAKERAAEADMKRERRLADAKVTAERDAEAARATFEAVRAERIAAEKAVQALGGSIDGQLGVLLLKSPISGQVVKMNAARGQMMEPSSTLFEVADLQTLWVELHVFERDIAAIRDGDVVEIQPQAQASEPLAGKVAHVGNVIDPQTRTADVRIEVENHTAGLRPGQSVRARIQTTAHASKLLVLPRQALTRVDGKPMVFVSLDKNTVEPRPITVGPEDTTRVAITDGLKEGEKVVVGGMFALKSELFR